MCQIHFTPYSKFFSEEAMTGHYQETIKKEIVSKQEGIAFGELRLWTVDQVAILLGISKKTVLKAIRDKKLIGKKFGGHTFVTETALWNFFEHKEL